MKTGGSTALVTGANRGLGRAFVQALRDPGCSRVYAAARTIGTVARDAGVEPVQIDITNSQQVSSAAARCHDVNILINNAGVGRFSSALGAPTMDDARIEMETNYFGTLAMCRAFAPVLKRNGGGALVNMLSVVSFRHRLPRHRGHRQRDRRHSRRRTLPRCFLRAAQGRPFVRREHSEDVGQPTAALVPAIDAPTDHHELKASLAPFRRGGRQGPAADRASTNGPAYGGRALFSDVKSSWLTFRVGAGCTSTSSRGPNSSVARRWQPGHTTLRY